MKLIASPQFLKKLKKLNAKDKASVDKHILKILDNPQIGSSKKQDLQGVSVYKFKLNRQEHLLSYRVREDHLDILTLGTHENYYRDLKKYLK